MADRKLDSCPRDCPRRMVGCRADCPDWAEHERRKEVRYAAARAAAASEPVSRLWEQRKCAKLRRQALGKR